MDILENGFRENNQCTENTMQERQADIIWSSEVCVWRTEGMVVDKENT